MLRDVNLEIRPGETVALVGATGSGKTSLTALVPRLYDVTGGRITLDGVDVRDFTLERLRSLVATAFEEPTLFSMSARENLTLGRSDATEAEISEALAVAQADFALDLPWGLDTRIGEQGMSLSGGQRQRLALARAVLAQPRVLVLDDTLSALDVHTEKLVEEALRRVLADTTGLIVAHRASTVMLADRVALLQHGTITHVGTHRELLDAVPAYRELLAADSDADLEGASVMTATDTTTSTEQAWRGVAADEHRRRPADRRDLGAARHPLAPAARRPAAALRHRAQVADGDRRDRERRAPLDPLPRQGRHRLAASRRSARTTTSSRCC